MNLKELAKELGVSQATVSRALNGYPEVNAETRKRVAEAARRLGYSANANARRLATGRANAIGILLTHTGELHISEFLIGMGQRLAAAEMDILVSPLAAEQDEIQSYRRMAAESRVDALILHSGFPHDPRIGVLNELRIPFVLHGRTEMDEPHAWLDIDNEGAFYRATSHLLDLGHRVIGSINGPKGQTFSVHRDRGYERALRERGFAPSAALMHYGRFSDELGFRFARSMLEGSPRPTAFIVGSMMSALGVFRAIRSAGLELGRDVSMIAHDDVFPYLNADTMVPSLSTTRSSMRAAGARIAELTMERLAGRPAEDIHELWPVELVLRESTRPPPR